MAIPYPLSIIQDDVNRLLERGIINRHQPIYALYEYIPARDWLMFEKELERSNFLLRDRIGDLVPFEQWSND